MAEKTFFEVAKFVSNFEAINDNLTKAKCFVLALGTNVNRTNFRKEVVDEAFGTLGFIPVVGHLMKGDDGKHYLGGHDYRFNKETKEFESLCEPFGVVLPSESPTYETVEEEDGTKNEYLTCDVILWTGRYPQLKEAMYSDKVMFGQSMEVYIEDSEPLADNKKVRDVLKFRFDALCMLNKSDDVALNVEPCFPSASIVSEYSKDNEVFAQFFRDIKEQLNEYFKGVTVLENEQNRTENFSATYGEKRKALSSIFVGMRSQKKDGEGRVVETTEYYLMDFDDEHCFVRKETWGDGKYDTFNYRIGYKYDAEKNAAELEGEAEEVISVWVTPAEKAKLDEKVVAFEADAKAAKEALATYQATHSHTDEEYDSLAQFKADALSEKRTAAINAVFAKYDEVLGSDEGYAALKADYGEASVEEIEDKCLRMVGMYSMKNIKKPEKQSNFAKTSAGSTWEDRPYGGFVEQYAPNIQ